eukprot:3754803-Rhodomonas_salina.1
MPCTDAHGDIKGTEWVEEDIRAIASSGVDFCMIPKVESGEDIQEVASVCVRFEGSSSETGVAAARCGEY